MHYANRSADATKLQNLPYARSSSHYHATTLSETTFKGHHLADSLALSGLPGRAALHQQPRGRDLTSRTRQTQGRLTALVGQGEICPMLQ